MVASTLPSTKTGLYADPRPDWLAKRKEEVLDPSRVIVDPHHHLWDRGGQRYLLDDITTDIASGHNVVATVYVEARSMYRAKGPENFKPVGEVEFANGAAAMSASGGYGPAAVCAGIVGHVNLTSIRRSANSPTLRARFPIRRSCSIIAVDRPVPANTPIGARRFLQPGSRRSARSRNARTSW
jgi:hypothetical protein